MKENVLMKRPTKGEVKGYEKLKQYALLIRLHKPIPIFLLLFPTLWALWLASSGKPNYFIVLIFVIGVFIMRSAGCIINDIADRNIDCRIQRTQHRPLAAGKIKLYEAGILFFCLLLIAFFLVLFLNRLTLYLAIIGALLAIIYPFLKRITHLPQLGLGLAYNWSIPMAFAALTHTVPLNSWLVFAAGIIWTVIYDTYYAIADREEDIKIGVKSTAVLFGKWDKFILCILQIVFTALLLLIGIIFNLHLIYFVSLLCVIILLGYQQQLIKYNLPENCLKAFSNSFWVGTIIFLGILF